MAILLKLLANLWPLGKCFFISLRDILPVFAFAFAEYGGLSQIIFHFLFFEVPFDSVMLHVSVGMYSNDSLYPLSLRAFSYRGISLAYVYLYLMTASLCGDWYVLAIEK